MSCHRRGAMLLEVMLAIALFVGAASLCLAVTRSLFSTLQRSERRQCAVDLARSKLAELEAGLITVQELRGEWPGAVGSRTQDFETDMSAGGPRWRFDAVTSRTAYRGLSLLELTVSEVTDNPRDGQIISCDCVARPIDAEEAKP